ncbi:MAG: MFS transporter [Candidatus Nanopelagicaceae bacterium]
MSTTATSLPPAFKRLWRSSVVSNLADGLLRTVVPIYAISLTESPILISLISAMTLLPWLFFAVIIGTLADRIDRKRLLIYSTLLRTFIVAVMAIAISAGVMSIYLLLALIFIAGACEVSIDTTAQSMIPEMLEKDQLERGNSRLFIAETVISQFIGSPLSGFLYALAVVVPFYSAGGGYLLALLILLVMPYQRAAIDRKERDRDQSGFTEELKFGLRFLFTHQRLRQLVIITTILGFLFSASHATIALFMVKELGLDPRYFGVVLAVQGVGGVAGGLLANRLSTRFTRGKTLAGAIMLTTVLILVTGFMPNIYYFTLTATLAGFASTIWNILLMSTYQVLIPNHLYGRIHGARRTIVWGLMPIGAFLGGVIATFGLRLPFIICGVIGIAVAIRALPFVVEVANSTIAEQE